MRLHNYLFDAFGPYPLSVSGLVSLYHQARRVPPDWREGFPGYAERYGSDFGTSAAGVTARYLSAEALGEDTMYYRCACSGIWPRVRHALLFAFIARPISDGHEIFSEPMLIQPYAGTFTAVYGWFPRRYGVKDAFRMGNFGVINSAVSNIGLEFLPSLMKPRGNSLVSRFHLDNRHAAHESESTP